MGKFAVLPPTMLIKTRQEAEVALAQLRIGKGGKRSRVVAIDTETTGLSRQRDYALIMSLSTGPNRYAIWPEAFSYFTEYLEDPELQLLMWNANFDTWMLRNAGIDIYRNCDRTTYRVFDAMIMHALDYDDRPHTLKYAAKEMLGIVMVDFKATFGAQMRTRKLHEIFLDPANEPVVANYAGLDAYSTFALAVALQKKLLATNTGVEEYPTLWDYFRHTEVPFTRVLFECESNGIGLDKHRLIAIAPELDRKMIALMRWFVKKTKKVGINLNSNPQMIELFFGDLGYNPPSYTEKGAPQLPQKWLSRIASDGCVYADKLLAYRDLKKKQATYVRGLLKLEHRGRIHTTYKQAGARTGRLSSADPNLQNQPGYIRFAYIAGEEKVLIARDYCFATGTLVDTPLGPRPIESLQVGDPVFSYDPDRRVPVVGTVDEHHAVGVEPVVEIELDNGERIVCTGEHKFMVCPEKYVADPIGVEAQDLIPGMRLLPLRRAYGGTNRNYEHLYAHQAVVYSKTHTEVAAWAMGARPEGYHTHHKDGDSLNNHPDNLEYLDARLHLSEHAKESCTRQWRDPETRAAMQSGIRQSIADRGGYNGKNNPRHGDRRGRVYTACLFCDQPIETFASTKKKYCSRTCYFDHKRQGGNHKVVAVRQLQVNQQVWSIGVAPHRNYALAAGVFVKNSQLEMRIVAHFSQEPNLIQAIRSGQDVHCSCAALMFKLPYDEIMAARARDDEIDELKKAGHPYEPLSPREIECLTARKAAKAINFGLIYGMGPQKLSRELRVKVEVAKDYIRTYFQQMPGVQDHLRRVIGLAEESGVVTTILGRRRQIPGIWSHLRGDIAQAERRAKNTPIQGTAADVTKMAMIKTYEDDWLYEMGYRMLLQVHDEIVGEAPISAARNPRFVGRLQHHMEHSLPYDLLVPLDTTGKDAADWAGCK